MEGLPSTPTLRSEKPYPSITHDDDGGGSCQWALCLLKFGLLPVQPQQQWLLDWLTFGHRHCLHPICCCGAATMVPATMMGASPWALTQTQAASSTTGNNLNSGGGQANVDRLDSSHGDGELATMHHDIANSDTSLHDKGNDSATTTTTATMTVATTATMTVATTATMTVATTATMTVATTATMTMTIGNDNRDDKDRDDNNNTP
ncbi:hypothetical protein EDB89DRAFT_1915156 [Lactarius sanguifluus]|nr:hypothetical protein EDB89DRAFT_1915156 [Lactarius sanguifluus]